MARLMLILLLCGLSGLAMAKTLPAGFVPLRQVDATILQDTQVAANRTKVRSILSGTRSINKETESDLQKMGIHVKRGGKHPKLFLAQDHRYKVTAPSSGSDVNGWQNVVRELNKVFL